jgi:prevent-host-death family protein
MVYIMVRIRTMLPIDPSDGIVPIARFKAHASRFIRKIRNDGRPIVITHNGESAAVVVTPRDYEIMRNRYGAVAEPVARYGGAAPGLTIDGLPWQSIVEIASRHGATRVRVFGSLARGDASGSSDLDLLVEMEPQRSLLDLIGLEQDLSDLLEMKVDVVTEEGLDGDLLDRILSEAIEP